MRKRVLSTLLAMCMLLALLPVSALAADSDFIIEDGYLIEYNGSGGDVTIPDGVTYIGGGAFWCCTGLTGITIPGSVTSIGNGAFQGCAGLTGVTIPGSVTSIGYRAFGDCAGLTSVAIGDGVTSIGGYAFYCCTGLTSVTIPDSVTSIEECAFQACKGLTSVTIPDGVTSIGNGAFSYCTGLTSVTIPDGVTDIGGGAFYGTPWLENQGEFAIVNGILIKYQGSGGDVIIPDGVTSVGDSAFYENGGLTGVTIPDSVTSIEEGAFAFCADLTSIAIPGSVTSIGEGAFYDCAGLTDVYYGGSESQWEAINIGDLNEPLEGVAIHYNSPMPQQPTVGGFSDVKTDAWYAESVLWAVENKITIGTSDTTFSPDVNCTQSQILTFLWRAKGEPAPAGAVSGGEWYAEAAQWATEQGLTDDFSAEAPCTRAMVVTYLWKLAGSPKPGVSNSFADVPDTLADAVSWAAEQGITTGTSETTFSPDTTCTRGQIVTFLYRDMAK